VNFCCRTISA